MNTIKVRGRIQVNSVNNLLKSLLIRGKFEGKNETVARRSPETVVLIAAKGPPHGNNIINFTNVNNHSNR